MNNVRAAEQLLEHCEPGRRGWEWRCLRGVNRPSLFAAPERFHALISSLVFSPDGRHLALTGWTSLLPGHDEDTTPVEVWDTTTGQRLHTLAGPLNPSRLSFSPDGRRLAASNAERARVWDVADGRQILAWQPKGTATFSPVPLKNPAGPKWCLASGGRDAVVFWDGETGEEVRRFASPGGSVTFSPDGKHLAISTPEIVEVRETASGRQVCRLPHRMGEVPEVAFNGDGRRLVVASTPPRLWDVTTGQPVHSLAGHQGAVPGVAFSPDGLQVATAGTDGTVQLWDCAGRNATVGPARTRNPSNVRELSPQRLVFGLRGASAGRCQGVGPDAASGVSAAASRAARSHWSSAATAGASRCSTSWAGCTSATR